MDKIKINNQVVVMRKFVKQGKIRFINKRVKEIQLLRNRKGNELKIAKCQRKADRLLEEVATLKKIKPDTVSRIALSKSKDWKAVLSQKSVSTEDRCLALLASYGPVQSEVEKFYSENSYMAPKIRHLIEEWEEKAASLTPQKSQNYFKQKSEFNKITNSNPCSENENENLKSKLSKIVPVSPLKSINDSKEKTSSSKKCVSLNSSSTKAACESENILTDKEVLKRDDATYTFKNVAKTTEEMATESRKSSKDEETSGSEEEISESEDEISESEDEISGSEEEISRNEEEISGSEEEISGSEKEISGNDEDSNEDGASVHKKVQRNSYNRKISTGESDCTLQSSSGPVHDKIVNSSNDVKNNIPSLKNIPLDSDSTKAVALVNLNELMDMDELPIVRSKSEEQLACESKKRKKDSFFLKDGDFSGSDQSEEDSNDEDRTLTQKNVKKNNFNRQNSFPPHGKMEGNSQKFQNKGFSRNTPRGKRFEKGDQKFQDNFHSNQKFKKFVKNDSNSYSQHQNFKKTKWNRGDESNRKEFKPSNPNNFHERKESYKDKQNPSRNNFGKTVKKEEPPLHPSWEAKRKMKQATNTKFQGKRMVFDD